MRRLSIMLAVVLLVGGCGEGRAIDDPRPAPGTARDTLDALLATTSDDGATVFGTGFPMGAPIAWTWTGTHQAGKPFLVPAGVTDLEVELETPNKCWGCTVKLVMPLSKDRTQILGNWNLHQARPLFNLLGMVTPEPGLVLQTSESGSCQLTISYRKESTHD